MNDWTTLYASYLDWKAHLMNFQNFFKIALEFFIVNKIVQVDEIQQRITTDCRKKLENRGIKPIKPFCSIDYDSEKMCRVHFKGALHV